MSTILKTRIQMKNDTAANWDKATNFIPLKGELIIYTDTNQMKIGDGTNLLADLPFMGGGEETVYIGDTEPTDENIEVWIDTSVEDVNTMRADAMKYTTFSIATTDWEGSSPYTYTLTKSGITSTMAILNLTLDAASQINQTAQLSWETTDGAIILSTTTIPTGTISGYLIAVEVVEI